MLNLDLGFVFRELVELVPTGLRFLWGLQIYSHKR